MKIKTVKLKTKKTALAESATADLLAAEYSTRNEDLKALSNQQELTKADIKLFARKKGKKIGKSVVVEGAKWVVGFSVAEYKPTIDVKKAQKLLSRKVWPSLWNLTYVLDETMLMQYVEKGKISKADFLAMLDQKPSSERILVKTIKEFYEDKDTFA